MLKIGVSLDEQERTPAARLDWLLAIHGAVQEVEAEQHG